jgi:hypothetical protein
MRKSKMKKLVTFFRKVMFGSLLTLATVVLIGAAAPKLWQGMLLAPTAEWSGHYGTNRDSYLAYNCWVQKQLIDGQGKVIAAMKKDIARLQLQDPNSLK